MATPNLTGHACTWTETVPATGNSNATHAAEVGKVHYIAGFSCTGNTASAVDKFTVSILDKATAKVVMDCWAGGNATAGQTAISVDLSNPIRMSRSNYCSITWTAAASIAVSGTIWGFTLDD